MKAIWILYTGNLSLTIIQGQLLQSLSIYAKEPFRCGKRYGQHRGRWLIASYLMYFLLHDPPLFGMVTFLHDA